MSLDLVYFCSSILKLPPNLPNKKNPIPNYQLRPCVW
jgi:hypothetical protein